MITVKLNRNQLKVLCRALMGYRMYVLRRKKITPLRKAELAATNRLLKKLVRKLAATNRPLKKLVQKLAEVPE